MCRGYYGLASFPGRSFPVFNYWHGRKREPGIHCVRMRQLCDAADASTAQCDAADVTNRVGGLHVILMWLICFVFSTMVGGGAYKSLMSGLMSGVIGGA